ncbi:MAG TPA: DUF1801 domain-containing protein [Thermoanaerobaculia bacterium]|nr:DUF1801 domain-containing protein [Thermoanaerobaculia bacterium]
MVQSKAANAEAYLDALPEDRRSVLTSILNVVRKHLPKGYVESVSSGAITWSIPLEQYPGTYNKQPLAYLALAAQKSHYALYMMGAYMDPEQTKAVEDAFARAGKKLDMGKSCVRFKKLDDIPLDELGKVIATMPPAELIRAYEQSRKK